MLMAALAATFKDDVLQEDPSVEALQDEMARLTGHEAGLFVISATMGNQLALRALLTQPPYSVIVDDRAHILHYEAGGVSTLTGATLQPVHASNRKYITLDDIKKHAVLEDWVQYSPTKVIAIENTVNGLIMPLDEVPRITAFAREHGIKTHLDGARICDAVVAGAATLPEYCQEFDLVTISLSKGLGAPLGSILLGNKDIISRARWMRQSLGGGCHQYGMLAAMAHVAFKDTFGHGIDGRDSLMAQSHRNAARVAELWLRSGGKLLGPTETNMVFLDLEDARISIPELAKLASEYGLLINKQRLVVHYRKFPLTTTNDPH
jgi:threonine aldolase